MGIPRHFAENEKAGTLTRVSCVIFLPFRFKAFSGRGFRQVSTVVLAGNIIYHWAIILFCQLFHLLERLNYCA